MSNPSTMKLLRLLLLLQSWSSLILAQDAAAITSQLPACAQICLFKAITPSHCQLTGTACVCSDTKIQLDIQTCVMQSCTVREGLAMKNASDALCHVPVRSKAQSIRITSLTLTVLSDVASLLRYAYKAFYADFGWDDLSVMAAQATGIPATIMIELFLIPNGLGRDVWTVPVDRITDFVRWLYVAEVLYFPQLTAQKLAFLFFFLRLFNKENIRRLLWITIGFTLMWGGVFSIIGIFQCRPISYFWTSWDGQHSGKCININKFAWANAGISVALDFWILSIPLQEAIRLNLSWRKKVEVCVMFSLGIFVTIVSIVRLLSLVHFANSTNATWDQAAVVKWSCIEINVGVICACLPAIRMLLRRLFPGLFDTNTKRNETNATIGRRAIQRDGVCLDSGVGEESGGALHEPQKIAGRNAQHMSFITKPVP